MKSYFVFDVESIGLHGEAFAVGGGVYFENGSALWEFRLACDPEEADGAPDDRHWVKENCPRIEPTHNSTLQVRNEFWAIWMRAKAQGAIAAADCGWPVEARFLAACVDDDPARRRFEGPYPFFEISSALSVAGIDPMMDYPRQPSEMPKHDPLADSRQSARLLAEALSKLRPNA